MKNNISYKIIFLLTILVANWTCSIKEDLTKGLEFNINTDILKAPLTVKFVDAKTNAVITKDIEITIKGTDAEIFDIAASKDLSPENGFLNIGLKKSLQYSPENPLEFTIYAKTDGYFNGIKSISLTDSLPQYIVISMAKKSALPDGASMTNKFFEAAETGLATDIFLETPLINNKTEQARFFIPAGSTFFDVQGNQLFGSAMASLAHFDNQNTSSLSAYPGGNTGKKGGNGSDLNGAFLQSAFVEVSLTIGGVSVSTIEGAAKMTLELNENSVNPNTGANIQPDDQIDIHSFNTTESKWEDESNTIIYTNNGKLECEYDQTHLSWWHIGYFSKYNCNNLLSIKSNVVSASPQYYIVDVYDVNTGALFQKNTYVLNNDALISFPDYEGITEAIRVYGIETGCQELPVLLQDFVVDHCSGVLNLGSFFPSQDKYNITISAYCEAEPSILVKPTAYVYYRVADCGTYEFLGIVRNGFMETYKLRPNGSYDFSINFGTKELEIISIKADPNLQNKTIVLEDLIIPKEYCNIIF